MFKVNKKNTRILQRTEQSESLDKAFKSINPFD